MNSVGWLICVGRVFGKPVGICLSKDKYSFFIVEKIVRLGDKGNNRGVTI